MRRMITQIEDIEFIERKNLWYLWYKDTTGELDWLEFENEADAISFRIGFNCFAENLLDQDIKFYFYEKTKLSKELINAFISFGNDIKIIENILKEKQETNNLNFKFLGDKYKLKFNLNISMEF